MTAINEPVSDSERVAGEMVLRHLALAVWERSGRPMKRVPVMAECRVVHETEKEAWDRAPAMCFNEHGGVTLTYKLSNGQVIGYRRPLSDVTSLETREVPDLSRAVAWVQEHVRIDPALMGAVLSHPSAKTRSDERK